MTASPVPTPETEWTRTLLRAGAAAGPLYVVVALAQIVTRHGFDVRRHAVSLLSNGEGGWVQITNFLLSGVLVIIGAIGLRRALRSGRGRTWGPVLLTVYGIGLLGAGVFKADPGGGFPPGVEAPAAMTRSGLLHFAFGALGFYALIAACFVFAVRFRAGDKTRALWSAITGAFFFVAFAAVASGSTSSTAILALYAAVFLAWIWHWGLMRWALSSDA